MGSGKRLVPTGVAAAVITRRVELLKPLRGQVERGQSLSVADQLALIDLVSDAIKQAEAQDERERDLKRRLRDLQRNARGLAGALDTMLEELDR